MIPSANFSSVGYSINSRFHQLTISHKPLPSAGHSTIQRKHQSRIPSITYSNQSAIPPVNGFTSYRFHGELSAKFVTLSDVPLGYELRPSREILLGDASSAKQQAERNPFLEFESVLHRVVLLPTRYVSHNQTTKKKKQYIRFFR